MKWTRLLAAATLIALGSAPAVGQSARQAPSATTAAERWTRSGDRIEFRAVGFAFPLRPGRLSLSAASELSHQGEGLDNALQYRTEDGEVFATVYVYLPGLAHPGLAAFATDRALRSGSPRVTGGDIRSVAAGGVPGTALRADYGNYRDGNASSAAFVKAGRWMIKLRVTGPEARRAEVEQAMSALLAGMRFRGETAPAPATPLAIAPCPRGAGGDGARALPDPAREELATQALLATMDGGGVPAIRDGERLTLPPRVPDALCLGGELRQGNSAIAVLRALDPGPPGVDGRTRLIGILSDSGTTLEVIDAPNLGRHITLFHAIGETLVLGGWDAPPSDAQIMEMIGTPNHEGGRIRSRVRLSPEGPIEVQLPSGATEPDRPAPVT